MLEETQSIPWGWSRENKSNSCRRWDGEVVKVTVVGNEMEK